MKKIYLLSLCLITVCFSHAKSNGKQTKLDLNEYQLVFSDEFNGQSLNWNIWNSDSPKNVKNETSRGADAVQVCDGELRMYVKRVEGNPKVKWNACSLFLKEPLEHNTYIECRFKSGDCTGVNNAFWLACKTPPNNTYVNRYEIDIVEARKSIEDGLGHAHLAWHDWKTYPYTKNDKGKNFDIAQGISVKHNFDQYNVWGLWYGENDLIFYLNGEEQWRGTTHPSYANQYNTGVGKSSLWNPLEEKRAYGRYGQSDWSYLGGRNGDNMHIILSNLPWGSPWTPLVEQEANGTYMAVDYVRIYKPKKHLSRAAIVDAKVSKKDIELREPLSLQNDENYYFSLRLNKKKGEELTLDFCNESGSSVGRVVVDSQGHILTGFSKLTSTKIAETQYQKMPVVVDGEEMVLVCRITAKQGRKLYDKDAISVWCIPVNELSKHREPFFYPNIADDGSTSITNQWHINQKDYSDEIIKKVKFDSSNANLTSFGRFKCGKSFVSVLD